MMADETLISAGPDGPTEGLIEPGNINLSDRTKVANPEGGGDSTVYSMSANIDGREVLMPRAADGKILSEPEAIERYRKTGEHLGKFDNPDHATAYAKRLHEAQERYYGGGGSQDPSASAPSNHFDQFDTDSDAGEPGLYERARLNAAESFYRGTLRGSTMLAGIAQIVAAGDDITPTVRHAAAMALGSNTSAPSTLMQDIPSLTDAEVRKWRDDQCERYAQIVADLARYDSIRPWGASGGWTGAAEGAAALGGQVGGGLLTPENLLGGTAKGAGWLVRTGKAALQQGLISGMVDPVRQYFDIVGGVQKEYSAEHNAWAFGTGAIIGGGLHVGGELISSARIKDIHANMASEDPQFASAATAERPVAAPEAVATVESSTPASQQNAAIEGIPAAGAAASQPEAVVATFKTAKGSEYTVHPDGTTTRDKAARVDVGHEGDEGLKPQTERTFYVSAEDGQRLGPPSESTWRMIDNQDGTVSLATRNADGKWGIAPSQQDVPVETAPRAGLSPLEVWGAEEVNGKSGFSRIHLGNEIVEVRPRADVATGSASVAPGELAALASRRGGGSLPMQRARPDEGVSASGSANETGTAIATVPEASGGARDVSIRSLQQQAMDLAKQLDFPLREGRIQSRGALGVFKPGTGVVRVREVPDFEVVAHEAGHAIEYKVGQDLTDLTEKFAGELTPMVTNPAAYDPSVHVKEGFAEFIRRYIGNPAWAEQNAPRFTNAFRAFMTKRNPEMLAAIDRAGEMYRAYLDAPSVDAIGSVIRSVDEEPHGMIGKSIAAVREDGLPTVVKSVLQTAYRSILDDKAPAAQAVRDLARAIRDQTGKPLDLKAADNPEVLLRLAARSQQAAIGDMMEGVRPYHGTVPDGPSLSGALEIATGGRNSGGWGKWDQIKKDDFSTYLVARRAEVLWQKFKSGKLLNAPAAFSNGDAARAIADLDAANPTFRQASQMVHDYTRQLLRKAYEGGLIPADLFRKLSTEEFYVPFMRDMSDKPMASSGFTSSPEGPGMTQVVKRMTGSSRDIKDPIESIMAQTFLVNRTLQHNDVVRSFVDLSKQAGIAGGKYVEKIPAQEAKQYKFDLAEAVEKLAKKQGIDPDDTAFITGALTDVFGEDPIMGSFFRMEPTGKRGEPIVFYKEGGELQAARFMSEAEGLPLYELVAALPAKMTDLFSEVVAASSSLVRTGIVTNPTFALSNYIRDQFATALLRSDYIPILSGVKGVYGEFTQSEAARLYGVGGGVSPGSSIAPVERAIEADVNALAKKGYLVNRVTTFKGAMELASFTEAGTRNSVFGKVFEAKKIEGLSDYEAMVEAAFQATDLLDFSRHGSRTDAVRRYIPFLNAHFQGLDKAYRTMVQPLLDRAQGDQVLTADKPAFRNALMSWTKVFGVGGVLGAGWAALNAGSEAYRDASPQLKGTHVVIPFGNKVILVPKPFELSLGFTAGEYAYQQLAQNDPRAASQFMKAAWDVLAPPNPFTDIPIIRTPIELSTGKSLFTGRDIVPDTNARRTPAEQYTDRTSALAKYIGRLIGVSPIKVDYAVGAAFGTWGRDAMALSQGVDQDTPAANWDDAVFFRRFIKDPTRTSDVTTKFWDLMAQSTGKYNQNVASYDNLVKTFHDADAQRFVAKLPSSEKAFVTLKSAANEDGKPAFNADQKRLHPLVRASDAVTLLNGLRKDLVGNIFNTFEGREPLKIDPTTRRDLIDNIRELAQVEMRNAFVIIKEPGYADRPLISPQASMDKIRALSPLVADEITARYATAKIYTTDAVAVAYPQLQRALVRDGSQADLGALAFDAMADGYEFGGERVKKPAKRRLQVVPKAQP